MNAVAEIESLGQILRRMDERSTGPAVLRAAVRAGNSSAALQRANEKLADALAELYWCKPYLLAQVLCEIPVWPCGHTPTELLAICKQRQAEQFSAATYRSISLMAAERCLERIIDESARLHIEETVDGN